MAEENCVEMFFENVVWILLAFCLYYGIILVDDYSLNIYGLFGDGLKVVVADVWLFGVRLILWIFIDIFYESEVDIVEKILKIKRTSYSSNNIDTATGYSLKSAHTGEIHYNGPCGHSCGSSCAGGCSKCSGGGCGGGGH